MSKKIKVHLIEPASVVRSVLFETPATAQCGETKVYTREDIDKAMGTERKVCRGCLAAVGDAHRDKDVSIWAAEGWTALLERVYKAQQEPSPRTYYAKYTFQSKPIQEWPYAA